MANDFWKEYNEQQRKIMGEREKALKGKPGAPLKVGKRIPGEPIKTQKTAGKKK